MYESWESRRRYARRRRMRINTRTNELYDSTLLPQRVVGPRDEELELSDSSRVIRRPLSSIFLGQRECIHRISLAAKRKYKYAVRLESEGTSYFRRHYRRITSPMRKQFRRKRFQSANSFRLQLCNYLHRICWYTLLIKYTRSH